MPSIPQIAEDTVSLNLTEEILQSMEVGLAFRDYNGRISSLDFLKASSYVVTASDDESICLYDVSTAACLKTINSKKYGVDLVCFTSILPRLYTSRKMARMLSMYNVKLVSSNATLEASFSPDGMFVMSAQREKISEANQVLQTRTAAAVSENVIVLSFKSRGLGLQVVKYLAAKYEELGCEVK
ncbi:hypothetical protein ABKV19_004263 [Rosa sericea]